LRSPDVRRPDDDCYLRRRVNDTGFASHETSFRRRGARTPFDSPNGCPLGCLTSPRHSSGLAPARAWLEKRRASAATEALASEQDNARRQSAIDPKLEHAHECPSPRLCHGFGPWPSLRSTRAGRSTPVARGI
jgi:hypothetical protein